MIPSYVLISQELRASTGRIVPSKARTSADEDGEPYYGNKGDGREGGKKLRCGNRRWVFGGRTDVIVSTFVLEKKTGQFACFTGRISASNMFRCEQLQLFSPKLLSIRSLASIIPRDSSYYFNSEAVIAEDIFDTSEMIGCQEANAFNYKSFGIQDRSGELNSWNQLNSRRNLFRQKNFGNQGVSWRCAQRLIAQR